MSKDGALPPGVTDRTIAEQGTHDLARCAGCGALFFAAMLGMDGFCWFCAEPGGEPDADLNRIEHDDRGDN
jgi:hypothetical protein